MRKINIFLLGILLFLFVASPIWADTGTAYPIYQGKGVEITAMDLLHAKFTDIKALNVKQTTDNYPNFYFKVKETISGGADAQAWGKAANLVAVFYRPLLTTHGYKTEVVEYKEINGRIQASYYRSNYMLIVTGPDKEKVTNLINVIADILS